MYTCLNLRAKSDSQQEWWDSVYVIFSLQVIYQDHVQTTSLLHLMGVGHLCLDFRSELL